MAIDSATYRQNLETRLEAIAAELAAMSATAAGGLPNVSGPGQPDHVGYRMSLLNEQKQIREELNAIEGIVENVTRGVT